MADFRRCLYALAFVALIAGLSMPASAQMQCATNSVPSVARAEGYAELMGDIIIDCTGGTPTAVGVAVQGTNIAVNLDTFVSSKVTAVVNGNIEFLESLMIIDEPNTLANPARPIRNCGAANEDTTPGGPGECLLLGQVAGSAASQYDGTCTVTNPYLPANPNSTPPVLPFTPNPAYNCHPNVFQGKSLILVTGQTNQVLFTHVPIDPPGTLCPATIGTGTVAAPQNPTALCHRIIRITNIRGDASQTGVATGSNGTSSINAQIIATPPGGLPVGDPSRVVSRVQAGLVTPILTNNGVAGGKFDFIQCKVLEDNTQGQGLSFTFREGFSNAFKPRSLQQVLNNGTAGPYNYTTVPPNTSTATTTNQNVPGTSYDTESGFMNNNAAAGGDNPSNPLAGGVGAGGIFVDTTNATGSSLGNGGTGIKSAGIATQGTRLVMTFGTVPTGSTIRVPNVVNLTNVVTLTTTGVAVLISGANGAGSGYNFGPIPNTGTTFTTTRAVYEVYFSNPGALEQLTIPLTVMSVCSQTVISTPCPNLPQNIPTPGQPGATVQGGFAPFYAPSQLVRTAALEPGVESTSASIFGPAVLPVPRFINNSAPIPLFSVVRCSCNLLFPFVTNAPYGSGNFDTGIAIANTSLDPGITFGFRASAQSGPVQLWFYNRSNTPAVEPNFLGTQGNTECTNASPAGSCTGTLATVPAGGTLLFALSSGGSIAGTPVLVGAPAFSGYVIAQTGFQYCHGFAFINKQGPGFTSDNMAMGYVANVLDPGSLPRTSSIGETDGQ